MANVIIVGVDGSDTANTAARRAAELAALSDATLHVVTAFDKTETTTYRDGTATITVTSADSAEATAAEVAADLRSICPTVQSSIVYGKPADSLVKEAARVGADIIVVGNKHMQGVSRVLGSVASAVSHSAPCDVYIVKTV